MSIEKAEKYKQNEISLLWLTEAKEYIISNPPEFKDDSEWLKGVDGAMDYAIKNLQDQQREFEEEFKFKERQDLSRLEEQDDAEAMNEM